MILRPASVRDISGPPPTAPPGLSASPDEKTQERRKEMSFEMTETIRERASYDPPVTLPGAVVERLRRIVGARHVLVTPAEIAAHSVDIGLWSTSAAAVVFPENGAE